MFLSFHPLAPALMRYDSSADLRGSDSSGSHEFKSGFLVVREKTIIIGNSIYSVRNISSLTIANLSTTKPFPKGVLVCGGLGILLLSDPSGSVASAGMLLLLGAILLLAYYLKTRHNPRFALSIRMNAGTSAGILSKNLDFLKQIAVVLHDAMDNDAPRNVTFNLDESVAIDHVHESAISVGAVRGDLVNNVRERHTYA